MKSPKELLRVYPSVQKTGPLPRVVIMEFIGGEKLIYRMEHLPKDVVYVFWHMSAFEQYMFLSTKFNHHHRRPRCQAGESEDGNLSLVPMVAHNSYNAMVSVVAKHNDVDIKEVRTCHMADFLLPIFFIFNNAEYSGQKLIDIRGVRGERYRWLKKAAAKYLGKRPHKVKKEDMMFFLSKVLPHFMRLALDHDKNQILCLEDFVQIMNEVWMPPDEPLRLSLTD